MTLKVVKSTGLRHIKKLNFNERTLHPPEKKISEDSDDERMSKCALTAVK